MLPILGGALALGLVAWLGIRRIVFARRRRSFSVREIPGFLTPEECDRLMALAEPLLEESKVRTVAGRNRSPARVAKSAVLDGIGDRLVRRVKQRMADTAGVNVNQLENLQVTRYGRVGYFIPHTDDLARNGIDPGPAGERMCSMIVYLNDGYAGGRTRFPRIGTSIRPEKGKAALFRNVDGEGRPEPYAFHLGSTVLSGEKWIINQFVRERPFQSNVGNRATRRRRAASQRR